MSDTRDFEMDTGDAPASEATPPPKPIVVIQYRGRGVSAAFWPPLLLLVAALAIASYQRQTPLQRPTPPSPPVPTAPEATGRIIYVESPDSGASYEPIEVRTEVAPSERPSAVKGLPAVPVAPVESVTAIEPRPVEPPRQQGPAPPGEPQPAGGATEAGREIRVEAPPSPPSEPATVATIAKPAIGFDPGPRAIEPMPTPRAEVSKDDVLKAIDREAERQKAKQEKLEDVKANALEHQTFEAWNKAQRERAEFHAELETLIRKLGNRAGPSIDALCERYGRNTVPEIRSTVKRLLSRSAAGLSFEAKIELMRKYGYPEPMILDDLYQKMYRRINTPGGPRDKFEVRVLAARILLGHPNSTPPRTAAPPPLTSRPISGAVPPPGPAAPRRP